LRAEFRQRRVQEGNSRIQLQAAEQSGRIVLKAEGLTFAYPGGAPVVRDFSVRILRGERVGLIGPNGSGKTTLLRLLCGQLTPTAGTCELGTKLQIAYFDQLRAVLDGEKTVVENVGGGNDFVEVNGQRRHIHGYLQDFLFTPERARMPVRVLSGGEKNRILIAKLFLQPSNLLVMDEPTNDLDAETLELLEEQIQQYSGTVLLVSHDRAFLNNVATSTLVLEGGGRVGQYAGGYDDWLAQRPVAAVSEPPAKPVPAQPRAGTTRKLSYKEKRELEEIGPRIEALEAERKELLAQMCGPEFYKRPAGEVAAAKARAATVEQTLEQLVERWGELEALRGDYS